MTTDTLPAFEEMHRYAITLNLCNKKQGFDNKSRMYTAMMNYKRILKEHIQPYAKYELYTEISRKGRIHLHGWIMFLSTECIYYYLLESAHHLHMDKIINIDIRDIKDDKWYEYITKDKSIIKKQMNILKIPYPLNQDNIDDFTIDTSLTQHWPPEIFKFDSDTDDEETP